MGRKTEQAVLNISSMGVIVAAILLHAGIDDSQTVAGIAWGSVAAASAGWALYSLQQQ